MSTCLICRRLFQISGHTEYDLFYCRHCAELPGATPKPSTPKDPIPKDPIPKGFATKDSGEREKFASGAVRDTEEGKPRYDLIPGLPLKRLAELYARGAKKYGDWNWTKGIPSGRCYSSAFRHLMQYNLGDKDEDHLAAVVFNVFCIMYFEDTEPNKSNDEKREAIKNFVKVLDSRQT